MARKAESPLEAARNRGDYLATAAHEAGHAVIAILHGIKVGRVNIIGEIRPDGLFGSGFNELWFPLPTEVIGVGAEAIMPILKTLHAGRIAQDLLAPGTCQDGIADADDLVRMALYAQAALRPPRLPRPGSEQLRELRSRVEAAAEELIGHAKAEAGPMVRRNLRMIKSVAEALAEHGELTGADIVDVMRASATDAGGPGG